MTHEQAAEYLFTIAGGTAVGAALFAFWMFAIFEVQDKGIRKLISWGIGAALATASVLAVMGGVLIMMAVR